MPDYLAIATACWQDIERPGSCVLLGLSGRALEAFTAKMRDGACMDLQEAMDGAWESGAVGLAGQLAFRLAAWPASSPISAGPPSSSARSRWLRSFG